MSKMMAGLLPRPPRWWWWKICKSKSSPNSALRIELTTFSGRHFDRHVSFVFDSWDDYDRQGELRPAAEVAKALTISAEKLLREREKFYAEKAAKKKRDRYLSQFVGEVS